MQIETMEQRRDAKSAVSKSIITSQIQLRQVKLQATQQAQLGGE
jgi:hypothetical protein